MRSLRVGLAAVNGRACAIHGKMGRCRAPVRDGRIKIVKQKRDRIA